MQYDGILDRNFNYLACLHIINWLATSVMEFIIMNREEFNFQQFNGTTESLQEGRTVP